MARAALLALASLARRPLSTQSCARALHDDARDKAAKQWDEAVSKGIISALSQYHESFAVERPSVAEERHAQRDTEQNYVEPQADGPDADARASTAADLNLGPLRPRPNASYVLAVKAGPNNTHVAMIEKATGKTLAYITGGTIGLKNCRRRGFEPAFQAATRALEIANDLVTKREERLPAVWVRFNGYGAGREAVWRALVQQRWHIAGVEDATPIAYGGCRPKKRRRV